MERPINLMSESYLIWMHTSMHFLLLLQDDRLRTPLLKLKLAVCSVMPEQMARYNMDCIAKVAKYGNVCNLQAFLPCIIYI